MSKDITPILKTLLLLYLLLLPVLSYSDSDQNRALTMKLKSTAFAAGAAIPMRFTCQGNDISPDLQWSGAPRQTRSFVLIVDDPDAPAGTWTHWLVWNIPPSSHALAANVPKEAKLRNGSWQGMNDFKRIGYGGPCPPPGKPHHYYFRLFALDSNLDLAADTTRPELEAAMQKHVIAQAQLMAVYAR